MACNSDVNGQCAGEETGLIINTGNWRDRTYLQRKRMTGNRRFRRILRCDKISCEDMRTQLKNGTNVVAPQEGAVEEMQKVKLVNGLVDELVDELSVNVEDIDYAENRDNNDTSSLTIDLTPTQHIKPAMQSGFINSNENLEIDLTPIEEGILHNGILTDDETSVAKSTEIENPTSSVISVQPAVNYSEGGSSWKSSFSMTPTKEDIECLLIKLLHMMDEVEVVTDESASSTTKTINKDSKAEKPMHTTSHRPQWYHFPANLKLKVETMAETEDPDTAEEGVTITVTTINVKKSALRGVEKSSLSVNISSEDMRLSHTSHLNLQFSFQDTSKYTDEIDENDIKALMDSVQESIPAHSPPRLSTRLPVRLPEAQSRNEEFIVPAKKPKKRSGGPRVYACKRRSLAQMYPRPSKLPNFPEIHKRLFENMESLVDYVSRKAKRAQKLRNVGLKRRKNSTTSIYSRKVAVRNHKPQSSKPKPNRLQERDCRSISDSPQPATTHRHASPTKKTVLKTKTSNPKLPTSKRATPECFASQNKTTKIPKTPKKPAARAPNPVKGSVAGARSPLPPRVPLVYAEDKLFPMTQRQIGITGDAGDARARNNFPNQARKIWRP